VDAPNLTTESVEVQAGHLVWRDVVEDFERYARETGVEVVDMSTRRRLLAVAVRVTVRGSADEVAEFGRYVGVRAKQAAYGTVPPAGP
jgi:hypothetical protein